MTTKTNEPNAIALLRQGVYVPDAADCGAILAAYDAIVSERDAAVRERDAYFDDWKCAVGLLDEARDVAHENAELAERAESEREAYRARLAACERVVEAARAVVLDAWKQHGYDQYNVGTATIAALRAAVAAETQGET